MYAILELPKSGNTALLKLLNLEFHKNQKILKEEIKEYNKDINESNLKKKNKEKIIDSSFTTLNKDKFKFQINNNHPSLNSTSNESVIKINNSNNTKKLSNYSQFHLSFQLMPKLKSKSPIINKISKKNKLINLKRNKKDFKDEINLERKDLLIAAYKKNPFPLLKSVINKIHPDKTLFEKKIRNYSDKNINNMKWINIIKKQPAKQKIKFDQNIKNIKANLNLNKSASFLNHNNKTEYLMEKLNKSNSNISFNNSLEKCIDINSKSFYNLYKLDNNNNSLNKIRKLRSKTENVDDYRYGLGIFTQKNKNNSLSNFDSTLTKMTESNFFENKLNTEEYKGDNNMNQTQCLGNCYDKINKKGFLDKSSDTNLDKLFDNDMDNKFYEINGRKQKYNLYNNNSNDSIELDKLNKGFYPRLKLYKNKNTCHKLQKREDMKSINLNISLQKSINCYNFNEVINLFDKKISLEKNTRINYFNNFRNRRMKYSSCNNANVCFLKKENKKNENNNSIFNC